MFLYLSLLSCGVKSASETENSNQPVGPNNIPAQQLHGTLPSTNIEVPIFSALNANGEPRSQKDFLDHRTVIWFYPITGTPG